MENPLLQDEDFNELMWDKEYGPQTVNAMYIPQWNFVLVPAAYIQVDCQIFAQSKLASSVNGVRCGGYKALYLVSIYECNYNYE